MFVDGQMKGVTAAFVDGLLEVMTEGVFTLDPEGRITSWNPAMAQITGFTADEALGKTCTILGFSKCLGTTCPAGFHQCGLLEGTKTQPKECFLTNRSGEEVPVIKQARLIRGKDGAVLGAVETVTDLTELTRIRLQMESAALKLVEMHRMDRIIGTSPAMEAVFSAIRSVAASEVSVLLQGESGTGKELVAGAIHYNSRRNDKPLVTVNCSALSESLLESELFGHVKGAFTGASRDRVGRFEEADGGTIFLDEIGEISPYIQVKLLRVLQEQVIERVGESKARKIDIRIISATNKDLFGLVKAGRFREDLYYRLKVFPIHLPPLRERSQDIPLLVQHFIRQQNEITGKNILAVTEAAMGILRSYPWPGNIRELENAVAHAFVLCSDDRIDARDLPMELHRRREEAPAEPVFAARSGPNRLQISREELLAVLDRCGWNKAEVGRQLGVSRTAIWKYMKKYEIPLSSPDDSRSAAE